MFYEYICDSCKQEKELNVPASDSGEKVLCGCGRSMRRNYQVERKQMFMPTELKNPQGIKYRDIKHLKHRSEQEGRPIVPVDPAYDNHPMFRPREKGLPPKQAFEKNMKVLRKKIRSEKTAEKRLELHA